MKNGSISLKKMKECFCFKMKLPHREVQSKRFIGKAMFLSAVGRPRFHPETGVCLWDGKIGIFPFVKKVAAQRNSANRPRGTLETKTVEVTRDVYREMLITQVVPALIIKFPDIEKRIYIQQDNAKPHIYPNDEVFEQACASQFLDVEIYNQPPNSPDLNINDLGFFRALQSKQLEHTCNNLDELVAAVEEEFEAYSPVALNKVWLSYQQTMIEIMKVDGQNSYKRPHMGKDRLIRNQMLPDALTIPLDVVQHAQQYVHDNAHVLL
jgi:hypothetical protein